MALDYELEGGSVTCGLRIGFRKPWYRGCVQMDRDGLIHGCPLEGISNDLRGRARVLSNCHDSLVLPDTRSSFAPGFSRLLAIDCHVKATVAVIWKEKRVLVASLVRFPP
jgi:hypothetical protein